MDTQCTSSTQMETCSSTGDFANPTTCQFACVGDACGGQCRPGEKRCTGNDLEQCSDQGMWSFNTSCQNACVSNACGGECRPGTKRCASGSTNQLETCDQSGRWQRTTCGGSCTNNECVSCTSGATECTSSTQVRTCNNGSWANPQNCTNACVAGKCGGDCRPGATRCGSNGSGTAQTCNNQGAWTSTTCPSGQSCQAGKCGSLPKILFITSQVYNGNLGGVSGADTKCQQLASAQRLSGTFKAFLSEPGQSINQRLSMEGGPFILVDKTVVANNWFDINNNNLVAFTLTEKGTAPPASQPPTDTAAAERFATRCGTHAKSLFWLSSLSSLSEASDYCGGFRESGGADDQTQFGDWKLVDQWSRGCSFNNDEACSVRAPLLCVQQ
jgi:hypothetical protein